MTLEHSNGRGENRQRHQERTCHRGKGVEVRRYIRIDVCTYIRIHLYVYAHIRIYVYIGASGRWAGECTSDIHSQTRLLYNEGIQT